MGLAAPKTKARFLFLLLPLAVAFALFALPRLRPAQVVASPVVRGNAIDAVYATGTVEAEDRVHVMAKTNGSILDVFVKEGVRVKKGDLIARIDNPVVTYELARGQVDLSAATAQAGKGAPQIAVLGGQWQALSAELDVARQELARAEKLAQTGAEAPADLERAQSRVRQLEGSLTANEAQQRALRIDLEANAARTAAQVKSLASRVSDTEVRTPIDGVVLTKAIEVGEVVSVNQPLFKIGDTSRLMLEVAVDEADIARVHDATHPLGASPAAVSLFAFSKDVFSAHVFEVLPDANRERKSFVVKVRLDQPVANLRSGMSAEVNIIAGQRDNALLAPTQAETNGTVWVVHAGRVRQTPVTTGIRDLLRVELREGVAEGDLVVVEGQDKLEDNRRVSPKVRLLDKLAPAPGQQQREQTTIQ